MRIQTRDNISLIVLPRSFVISILKDTSSNLGKLVEWVLLAT